MTNRIHLLLEREDEKVGSIMQRVLGGYSRYYNRKYKHVGHGGVSTGAASIPACQS